MNILGRNYYFNRPRILFSLDPVNNCCASIQNDCTDNLHIYYFLREYVYYFWRLPGTVMPRRYVSKRIATSFVEIANKKASGSPKEIMLLY